MSARDEVIELLRSVYGPDPLDGVYTAEEQATVLLRRDALVTVLRALTAAHGADAVYEALLFGEAPGDVA